MPSVTEYKKLSYNQQQYIRRECVEIVGLPEDLNNSALEKKEEHRLKRYSVVIAKCVNRRVAIAILRAKKTAQRDGHCRQ